MLRFSFAALALAAATPSAATVVNVSFADFTDHSTYGSFSYDTTSPSLYFTVLAGTVFQEFAGTTPLNITYAGSSYEIPATQWFMFTSNGTDYQSFSVSVIPGDFSIGISESAPLSWFGLPRAGSFMATTGTFSDNRFVSAIRTPINITFSSPAPIPEPASWAMFIGGFGFIGGAMRLQRRSLSWLV